MAGMLVAFEGIDGAGKTEVRKLIAARLRERGERVVECGELQSPWADAIRAGLGRHYTPFVKTFLFAADRAWTYEKVGLPALEADNIVLWDRYVDSAFVYRGVEMASQSVLIDLSFVQAINRPFRRADLTILLDLPVATAHARSRAAERQEPYSVAFLERVRAEYLRLAEASSDRYLVVNADASLEKVSGQCERAITTRRGA